MSKFCICFLMCFVTKLVKKSISKCWAIEYYHYKSQTSNLFVKYVERG